MVMPGRILLRGERVLAAHADVLGVLQRLDDRLGVGAAGGLDRVEQQVGAVVALHYGTGWVGVLVAGFVGFDERLGLVVPRGLRQPDILAEEILARVADVFPKGGIDRLATRVVDA